MKTATIYKRPNKRYIIFGNSKTVSGFRIATGPYFNIPDKETDSDAIANAIKASLCNDDNIRVPDPKDWKQYDKDFLKNIGLKAIKELDNPLNKCVAIKEDNMLISFTPYQPAKKPDKGFVNTAKSESISVVATASNYQIMEAYEFALSKCG